MYNNLSQFNSEGLFLGFYKIYQSLIKILQSIFRIERGYLSMSGVKVELTCVLLALVLTGAVYPAPKVRGRFYYDIFKYAFITVNMASPKYLITFMFVP